MSLTASLSLRLCKIICANGGSMEQGLLCQTLKISPEQLSEMMGLEEGRSLVVRCQDSNRFIVYVSSLRMCADRNQECKRNCGRLHLCRFFILGGCSRPHCKFAHNIDTDEDVQVLKAHQLVGLTIIELRFLLLQNDPGLLPDVCLHYNRGEGLYGSCTYKTDCNKLHICQHFLQGDCKFGGQCKRSHDIADDEAVRKLMRWGLAASLVPQVLELYLNASAIRKGANAALSPELKSPVTKDRPTIQRSTSTQPMEEICLYFILNTCSFKDRCLREHYHLPYRWQVFSKGTWKDLPNMDVVERAYCDPNSRDFAYEMNFDAMTFNSQKLRRLSTPSSASRPPHFLLTTEWLWYWKDEYGRWIEYGKEGNNHDLATAASIDLENAFLPDENAVIEFKAGKHSYKLSFKEMVQRNVRFGTERSVCRRPKYVSTEDVTQIKMRKSDPSKASNQSLPGHWDMGQVPQVGYKLVRLVASSSEYKGIEAMFLRTLSSLQIQSIERIQNRALWEVYQWQKEQMRKRNGGKEVEERQVFHGTSGSLIDAICQQNFDWRICGAHGTAYGKGSYFARDASYSHKYCKDTNSHNYIMIVARVLVGEYVHGSSSYLRPPAKGNSSSSFYDSCVDSVSNPSIFVIFEKHQIYPEYLIRYTEKQDDMQNLMSALRRGRI